MLNLNSVMVGSMQHKKMVAFYQGVFGKKPDMEDSGWTGWMVGSTFFAVGEHSKMKGAAKDAGRVMFNFETKKVKEEFERITKLGAKVIKEPYQMGPAWIVTLSDPDGNYFQLMTPWEG